MKVLDVNMLLDPRAAFMIYPLRGYAFEMSPSIFIEIFASQLKLNLLLEGCIPSIT